MSLIWSELLTRISGYVTIEEAIEELAKMLGSIGSATAIQAMSAQLESLDAELQELEAEHSADGTVEAHFTLPRDIQERLA